MQSAADAASKLLSGAKDAPDAVQTNFFLACELIPLARILGVTCDGDARYEGRVMGDEGAGFTCAYQDDPSDVYWRTEGNVFIDIDAALLTRLRDLGDDEISRVSRQWSAFATPELTEDFLLTTREFLRRFEGTEGIYYWRCA